VGKKPEPDMARKTLTRWRQLGIFTVHAGDRLGLAPEVESVGVDDVDVLRWCVLRILLSSVNNPELISEKDTDGQEVSVASDFTRAAGWVLAQDPVSMPAAWPRVEALQAEQNVNPRPFVNDTRWQGFVEWSVFCGLAFCTARTFVPDPALAIRGVLPEVFDGSPELSQEVFLGRLASALPVLDGGTYRTVVDATIRRPWRKLLANELSPSVSLALQHLESSGDLVLESRSDAPQRRLLGSGGLEVRSVSHILRVGERA
jgi:hypothetical protein